MHDFIGIDPGVGGGIAAVNEDGVLLLQAMPDTEVELFRLISRCGVCKTVIEKVSGWIGGNKKKDGGEHKHGGAPGSAMFAFGMSYGACRMALTACGIVEGLDFDAVMPQTWQKSFEIPTGMEYGARKRYCRDLAQKIYPAVKVTLKTADALLIATFCARKYS